MSLTRITSDLIKDGTVAVADLASATKTAISGSSASGSVSTRTTALETASGSFSTRITNATASINSISSSQATRTANLVIASSSLSSSVATLKGSGTLQSVATNASPTFAGATITGTLTAQEVHTEFESASIIFSSGSTIFGDTADDIHQMTGSLRVITNAETNVVKFFNDGGDQNRDVMILQGGADAGPGNTRFITFNDGNGGAFGFIQGPADGATAGISFNTTADTALLTLSGSQVGIGTNNPQTGRLHIHNGDSGATSYVQLTQDGTGTSGTNGLLVGVNAAEASIIYNGEDTPLIFYTNASERIRINETGVVGIGTNSMSGHVHTYSDLRYMLYLESTYGTDRKYWFRNDGGTLQLGEGAQGDSQVGVTFDVTNKKLAIGTRSATAELTVIGQISGSNTIKAGRIADNGKAFVADVIDGGAFDVLEVTENGNFRWGLVFEGNSATNDLTINSNAQSNVANIKPDGTIYFGAQQSTLAKNTSHRLNVQAPASTGAWISSFANNGYPAINLYRTNNTSIGSYTATDNNDTIGSINWYGSSASAHTLGASIDVRQDGSASTYTPTRMDIYVSNGSNISNPLMSLDGPTQGVGIGTKVPSTVLHNYIANGTYSNDSTSHFINQAGNNRATIRNRSNTDNPSEIFFDINGAIRWCYSARETSDNSIRLFPQGSSPSLTSVAGSVFTLTQGGNLTIGGSYSPFTGTHLTVPASGSSKLSSVQHWSSSLDDYVGKIVVSSGTFIDNKYQSGSLAKTIDEAWPQIELANIYKDKKVLGVVSGIENNPFIENTPQNESELRENEHRFIGVNSLGEGCIWISNLSGSLENGDYITSSPIEGYGMKQDDDLLHNYTVAKISEDCDFSGNGHITSSITHNGVTYKTAFVGCTYHCG